MGCLLSKNNKEITTRGKELNKELNDEEDAPGPISKIPTLDEINNKTDDFDKYSDITQKKKLAEFLLNNDIKIFKRHVNEVKNMKNEEFYELFEGNTEYNYSTQNKREFKQLAQKFDDNRDLTSEYYDREEYYEYILKIWKSNILYKLKAAENEKEQNIILQKNNINISLWDDEFKEHFYNRINEKPIKSLAQRAKNYIEVNYGDFDELIKSVTHCKKKVENDEQRSHCHQKLCINLDTVEDKIVGEIIPNFVKQIGDGFVNLNSDFKKKEELKAIQNIKKSKLSKTEEKELILEIKKIYKTNNDKEEEELEKIRKKKEEEEEKKKEKEKNNRDKKDNKQNKNIENSNKVFSSIFDINDEFTKLKDLSNRFNESSDNRINFDKLNLKEKARVVFSNKMIKHAVLGISLANVSYSVLHLSKTIMDYHNYAQDFRERLDKIKNNFISHQNEVKYINEDDIDTSIEQIIECGKKFNSDLEDVEELIKDIKISIDQFKKEKNKSTISMVRSGITFLAGLIGAGLTEGSDKGEYIASAVSSGASLITSGIDFAIQDEAIEEFQKHIHEAFELKKQINNEINKLRNKFYMMSRKHYS